MPLYSAAAQTAIAPLTVTAACGLRAVTGKARLRELGFWNTQATASSIALVRPTNTPSFAATANAQGYDTADAVLATQSVGTQFTTMPTVSTTAFMRRFTTAAAIGSGIIWQFDDLAFGDFGTSMLVLWNFGAATASNLLFHFVWEE